MSKLLRRSDKQTRTFVQMVWGFPENPTYLNIWDGSSDFRYKGALFYSEPALEVELPEQGIDLDEEPTMIRLPIDSLSQQVANLTAALSSGRPFSKIRCMVFEIIDDGPPTYLATGYIETSDSGAFSGSTAAVELELHPPFKDLEQNGGSLTLATCQSAYLGQGCFKPVLTATSGFLPAPPDAARIGVQFTSISGREVSVTPDQIAIPTLYIENMPADWWTRGSFDADGISIPISSWEQGTTTFVVENWLPYGWGIGNRAVYLYPGCPKTPAGCFQRNNLSNFSAYGYGTPAINPILEQDDRS